MVHHADKALCLGVAVRCSEPKPISLYLGFGPLRVARVVARPPARPPPEQVWGGVNCSLHAASVPHTDL